MTIQTDLHREFCAVLRKARADRGLTQEQAAELLLMTRGQYAGIESGQRSPLLKTIERISAKFKINLRFEYSCVST